MAERNGLKYFKGLRVFTIIAVYLTTIMLAILLISSFVSGATSGNDTRKVMGLLVSIFGEENALTEPTSFTLSVEAPIHKYRYNDEVYKLTAKFYPESSKNYPILYTSSDDSIATVDNDGNLTFLKRGTVTITATVQNQAKLKNSISLTSYGTNPLGDYAICLKQDSIKRGGATSLSINDGNTSVSAVSCKVDDENVVVVRGGTVYGVTEGTTNIVATFEDQTQVVLPITVVSNPNLALITDLEFVENPTYIYGEVVNYTDIIKEVTPTNSSKSFIVTSSNEDIIKTSSGRQLTMKNTGTVTLTFRSIYNPTLVKDVLVTVEKIKPESLIVEGADVIMVNGYVQLKARHTPEKYSKDVVWSVVKGHGEIDENGRLKAKFFGKITVRCQSTLDPELVVEKTLQTKLYTNVYYFVRKILGHFSMFAMLGFGIWGCTFLLVKPHWFSFLTSPGICFVCSSLCELFQACTPGRYFTIADVFINFMGTMTGMLIAMLFVGIACIIWLLVNKNSFYDLKRAYNYISIKTVFMMGKNRKKNKKEN